LLQYRHCSEDLDSIERENRDEGRLRTKPISKGLEKLPNSSNRELDVQRMWQIGFPCPSFRWRLGLALLLKLLMEREVTGGRIFRWIKSLGKLPAMYAKNEPILPKEQPKVGERQLWLLLWQL